MPVEVLGAAQVATQRGVQIAVAAGAVAAASVWWITGDIGSERRRLESFLSLGETRPGAAWSWGRLLEAAGAIAPLGLIEALGGRSTLVATLAPDEQGRWSARIRGGAMLLWAALIPLAVWSSELWFGLAVFVPLISRTLADASLRGQRDRTRSELERKITAALDVFVLALDAGLPFDHAVAAYTANADGPLAQALDQTAHELEVGYRHREAIERTVARTGSAGLGQLAGTLRLAEDFGTPLARALRGLALDMRASRRQRIQEAALRAPVTMLLPRAAFILVPIFAIILGPVVLRVLRGSFF